MNEPKQELTPNPPPTALCHRCEYRAQFHEIGRAPRCECGSVGHAVWSCYMYDPVKPVMQEVNEGDRRPIAGGWMIAPRAHRVEVPEDFWERVLVGFPKKRKQGQRFLMYWKPKEVVK